MQSHNQIQQQIGQWSRQNFGGQETPYLETYAAGSIRPGVKRDKTDRPGLKSSVALVVALRSLAPLMGVVEEIGEFFALGSPVDKRDALGNVAVYLCDYTAREGLVYPDITDAPPDEVLPAINGMVANLGKIFHCHLKRHQRIRDMHDDTTFTTARNAALNAFAWHLERVARAHTDTDVLTLLNETWNETWNEIVSKQDWRADAAAGGGHKHDADAPTPPVGSTLVNTPGMVGSTRVDPVTDAARYGAADLGGPDYDARTARGYVGRSAMPDAHLGAVE